MLKLQSFGHLMCRADSLEKTLMLRKTEGGRRGRQRRRWLDGITNIYGHEFEQTLGIVEDRGCWLQSMGSLWVRQDRQQQHSAREGPGYFTSAFPVIVTITLPGGTLVISVYR